MTTHIQIDISTGLKDQFQKAFSLKEDKGEFYLDATIGEGQGMRFLEFPGKMEFYHFKKAHFHNPVIMTSINPDNSKWFLIHVNLSKIKQEKIVEGKTIEFHKYLPIGILLYGASLEITAEIPAGIESEVASIRFHRSFLDSYFESWKELIDVDKNLVYEDLDHLLESQLLQALAAMDNKILCHAKVLDFINRFFEKLKSHDKEPSCAKLHSNDIKHLFLASTHLRNPLATTAPSLDELASIANMGTTKFKTSFKQLFGSAPIQYRNKVRMEYARNEIVVNKKSPTEVSYQLGYSHPSSFTVAYKQHFNELPSSNQ